MIFSAGQTLCVGQEFPRLRISPQKMYGSPFSARSWEIADVNQNSPVIVGLGNCLVGNE
jgi:hypothetical protein